LEKKAIHLENIGLVVFTLRKNSKRVSMRIKSDHSISVNHPWYLSMDEVLDFVKKNTDWINRQKERISSKRHIYQAGESVTTKFHALEIKTSTGKSAYANIENGRAVIVLPQNLPVEDEKCQLFIKKILAEVYRREAIVYLTDRIIELARQHGFQFKNVRIKKLRSKWGSCSREGNINLNLYLMALPDHLIDYILLHELAHTAEPNHGAGFWRLLNQLTNNQADQLDKEMKKHRIE